MRPSVFVIHDIEHGNTSALMRSLVLPEAFELRSFTDTHPDTNRHNADIGWEAFYEADYLYVQDRLLMIGTETVRAALTSTIFSSAVRTEYGQFNEDYHPTRLSVEDVMATLER